MNPRMSLMKTNLKKALLASIVITSGSAAKAAVTPMNLVEKSSYRLTSLVQKGTVPTYMSTDLAEVQINSVTLVDGRPGTAIVLLTHSNNPAEPNSVTVNFSADGKLVDSTTHIVGQGNPAPIFVRPDGAKLLDLAAEAVVDHLSEDAALPVVARDAQLIDVSKESGALFAIHLKDGRVYKIHLGLDGKFISRGF